MPGWAGSCWYYLRFMDPQNDDRSVRPGGRGYWGNVDLYIGGTEHAVLHLLYARFWHKVLFDEGVQTKEPFQQLFNQGMLTAFAYKDATGRLVPADEVDLGGEKPRAKGSGEELEEVIAKMSKSLKNVVNPDDVCAEFGVDTFRLYEMFMGPLADSAPWNPRGRPAHGASSTASGASSSTRTVRPGGARRSRPAARRDARGRFARGRTSAESVPEAGR